MVSWPCEACFERPCAVCGHETCPVCLDDCDHSDCIVWAEGRGEKTHVCVFEKCPACGHVGPIPREKEENEEEDDMANPMVAMAVGMAVKHQEKLAALAERAKKGENVGAELESLSKEFAGSVEVLKKAVQ